MQTINLFSNFIFTSVIAFFEVFLINIFSILATVLVFLEFFRISSYPLMFFWGFFANSVLP